MLFHRNVPIKHLKNNDYFITKSYITFAINITNQNESNKTATPPPPPPPLNYNEILVKMDTYATIGLSSLSCLALLFFTFVYIDSQIKYRDHAKETKKSAFKKIFRHEYLVFSYCLSLFFSHLFSIAHKVMLKFYMEAVPDTKYVCLILGIFKVIIMIIIKKRIFKII